MSKTNGIDDASVIHEVNGDILVVRLNRPAKRNAISDEMILSLEAVFSSVSSIVRCAIICAEGEHFSAGLDLSALREKDVVEGVHHSRMWHRALDQLQFGKIPIIAVLKGACVGGGLELASACHVRVAEKSTFYALPEGQRGIFVGGGAAVRLPKLIGVSRVTDMMLTGRVVPADEGLAIGISQYVVSSGEGMTKGMELAKKIASNAPMTNYALMHALPRIADAGHDQASMMESLMAAIAQNTPEAKERMRDFLEGKSKKVGDS